MKAKEKVRLRNSPRLEETGLEGSSLESQAGFYAIRRDDCLSN